MSWRCKIRKSLEDKTTQDKAIPFAKLTIDSGRYILMDSLIYLHATAGRQKVLMHGSGGSSGI